jgi:FtsP/CotA-like multicopper oxidase with cupredoxin domain
MKKSPIEPGDHSPVMKAEAEDSGGMTRREFVTHAVVATSAVALAGTIPSVLAQVTPAVTPLAPIGEIVSKDRKLKGILRITNGAKNVPGWTTRPMMRYFEGLDQQHPYAWPPDKVSCLPGPTLRASVGDRVELTLINKVKVDEFGGSLDQAERGETDGCDHATNAVLDPPVKDWYPKTVGDTYPNCYHGSSTGNLHFHGSHVSPDGFGDNVLVSVRPDPSMTDDAAAKIVDGIFKQCEANDALVPWDKLPESFTKPQLAAIKEYDLTAIWKGVRGPVIDPVTKEKVPALPYENQLAPINDHDIEMGFYAQYFSGVFPNCFKIPEAAGHEMGQAPGTHWYHAHKHGSTSVNLTNGLAGVMIIEGQYDKDLANIPNLSLKANEKVMIVQVFSDQPDLERPKARPAPTLTNGSLVKANGNDLQTAPNITMQPGEIQFWRIVNAQVGTTMTASFKEPSGATKVLPTFRQIAQDGVQFSPINYTNQPLTKPDGNKNGTTFTLAPGGRIDILVQAPLLPSGSKSGVYQLTGICNLTVEGNSDQQLYPTESQFPTFPDFLKNIGECNIKRTVTFGWEPQRVNNGAATDQKTHGYLDTSVNPPVQKFSNLPIKVQVNPTTKIEVKTNMSQYFTIDNEQFHEDKFYQTVVLGDQEEWTVYNMTAGTHPFHIHVNPFQVTEIFDPNVDPVNPVKYPNPVWMDVINIPAALSIKVTPEPAGSAPINAVKLGPDNKAALPGYIKFRSRFVDFTGTYVLHCHILDHEDRGMMQLVRVIDKKTPLKHH